MKLKINDRFTKMLLRLPIAVDWVEFKGETYFAQINYQATEKAGKPMIDLSYCATVSFNGIVDKTVQWDKSKFKPSRLSNHWKKGKSKIRESFGPRWT